MTKLKQKFIAGGFNYWYLLLLSFLLTLPLVYFFPKKIKPPTIKVTSNNDYLYEAKNTLFSTKIATQKSSVPTVAFSTKAGGGVLLKYEGSSEGSVEKKENTVFFRNVDPKTDFSYTTLANGIKEEIIIKSISENINYNFTLNTQNASPKKNLDGSYSRFFFNSANQYQFHIEKPFAIDANGQRTDNVSLKIRPSKENSELYQISLSLPEAWLTDKNRAYPIVIDPTFVYDTSAEFATGIYSRTADSGSAGNPLINSSYQEAVSDPKTLALYHFNSGSCTTDSSGNGNTLTAVGGATCVSGGVFDYHSGLLSNTVNYSQGSVVDLDLPDGSIEAWINPNVISGTQTIFYADSNSDTSLHVGSTGQLIYYTSSGNTITTVSNQIPINTWTHVAATWTPGGRKLYINGKEVASDSQNILHSNRNYVTYIGVGAAGSSNFFSGTIDDLKISNVSRTKEEIKSDASFRPSSFYSSDVVDFYGTVASWNPLLWTEIGTPTGDGETLSSNTGLVAQWNFNETSGTTADNAEGTAALDFTLNNFASTASQDQAAASGWTSNNKRWGAGAISLSSMATADTLSITNPANNLLDVNSSDLTIETWIKTNDVSSEIISNNNANGLGCGVNGYYLGLDGNGNVVFFVDTNGATAGCDVQINPATKKISDGQWHHLVATVTRGVAANIYVDGVLAGTDSTVTSYSAITTTSSIYIGGSVGGFDGAIDSTRFYSRALSEAEIVSNSQSANIEFQTRVGNSTDPNDGTWEEWRPVGSETALDSMDSVTNSSTTDPNLVAYWPMDESSGSTVVDNIAASNGTVTGTTVVDGVYGNARNFNGTSDSISVSSNASLSPTSAITVEGWFKPSANFTTSSDYNQGIFDKGDYQLFLDKTDGKLKFVVKDNTSKSWSTLSSGITGNVISITPWAGSLYASGFFTSPGASIAKWNGSAWSALGTGIVDGSTTAINGQKTVFNNILHAVGQFSIAGGFSASNIAKWNGSAWSALGTGLNGAAYGIAVYGGNLYTGGEFTSAGGVANTSGIAKWNGSSWSAVGTGITGGPYTMAVYNNELYVGGAMTAAGGTSVNNIAKWNGSSWSAVGTGITGGAQTVRSLAIYNDELYVGGIFSTAGGTSVNNIAKWNGSSWSAVGTGVTKDTNPIVSSMVVYNGELYVGGSFTSAGGTSVNNIAKWNGSSWSAVGTGTNAQVNSLSVNNGDLYVSGSFSLAGGVSNTSGVAKWGTANTVSIASTTTSWTASTWYHYAVVSDGTNLKLYINGALQSTAASPITLANSSVALKIGRTYGSQWTGGSGEYFSGALDEIKIYNTAKSATEIATHYTERPLDSTLFLPTTDSVVKTEGSASVKIKSGIPRVDTDTTAFWHLDETGGTGAYLKDVTTKLNHGTPTGTTTASGLIGNSRSFNGTSDHISVGALVDGTAINSVDFWVYPTSTTTRFIDLDGGTHYIWVNAGTVTATGFTSPTIYVDGAVSSTLVANKWQHVAVTTATSFSASNVTLGKQSTNYFSGKLDEVRISSIVRTAEEMAETNRAGRDIYFSRTLSTANLTAKTSLPFYIAADRPGNYLDFLVGESSYANYQPDANTIAFWHFEEKAGSGAYLKDSSNTLAHGTPTSATFIPGKIGNARGFTTSQYISLGSQSLVDSKANLTIDAWIFPTAQTAATTYYVYCENLILCIGQYGSQVLFQMGVSNFTVNDTTGGSLLMNQWNHVAWVKSGTSYYIYINGVLTKSGTGAPATLGTSSTVNYISTSNTSTSPWLGSIDELRMSDSVRTADEIRQAYEYGARTHSVTIDFGAHLDSGNLIANNADTTFTVDATVYGLTSKGAQLFPGDKIIIKENYDGTEYIAQGLVNTVNSSTGAVTVSSWDASSTFPSVGFSIYADVFKWQREFWNINNTTIDSHFDSVTSLVFKLTNSNEGRNVWIDDLKSSEYLTTSTGSTITSSTNNTYGQYRAIFQNNPLRSATISAVTFSAVINQPEPPTTLSGTALTSSSIRWDFTDNASNETGYKLFDSSGNYLNFLSAASVTSITETGLSPNTSYIRKVAGYNNSGNSHFTSTASRYTLANTPGTTNTVRTLTTAQVTINENSNPSNTTYAIYKDVGACDGSGGSYLAANGSDNGNTAVWQTLSSWSQSGIVTATGLDEEIVYSFCVKAKNSDGVETSFSSFGQNTGEIIPISGDLTVTSTTNFLSRYRDGNDPNRYIVGLDSVGANSINSSNLNLNGGSVTINSDETLVAGKINFNGGTLFMSNTGARIAPGAKLWGIDRDADGYADVTNGEVKLWYGETAPQYGRRKALLATLKTVDCNDNAFSSTNLCCVDYNYYLDSDGDGFGTGNAVPFCQATPTTPNGYSTNNTDCDDNSANTTNFLASGGTTTTISGYKVHTFNISGNFVVSCGSRSVEYLIVAGGGGGGGMMGGGGGGGGLVTNTGLSLTTNTYTIQVGPGGNGGGPATSPGYYGVVGGNSFIGLSGVEINGLIAYGGGRGAYYNAGTVPGNGGSGSGAPGSSSALYAGGQPISGQGHVGGNNATTQPPYWAGGGGGAGADGGNGVNGYAGLGGNGLQSSITGAPTYYSGGGGGGGYSVGCLVTTRAGGLGGGGTGTCQNNTNGTAGTANTGGGGGGGGYSAGVGGAGGSGIVIIRYVYP